MKQSFGDYCVPFLTLLVFFAAIGLLVSSVITLGPDSDRCSSPNKLFHKLNPDDPSPPPPEGAVSIPGPNGNSKTVNKISNDSIIMGSFALGGALASLLLALGVYLRYGDAMMTFYAMVSFAGFAALGIVSIIFALDAKQRCPSPDDQTNYANIYNAYNGVEISSIAWSIVVIAGVLAPIVKCYVQKCYA